ncbi:Mob1/phocein [Gorgonomyces haynaldii]|nr:Mob1/phocein [Gorgonomyces haynaldii]
MQGGREEYYWMDSQKKPLKLPANQYVDFAQNWMQSVIMDETIFPTKNGSPFPPNFASVVRSIFRQLFRILDHIYHNHYEILLHVSAEQHLNTLAAHLICFSKEYDLIDKKEMLPMQEFQQLYESLGRI